MIGYVGDWQNQVNEYLSGLEIGEPLSDGAIAALESFLSATCSTAAQA